MSGIEADGDFYRVSSKLVHWLITSIIGSIVAIGCYMAIWATQDAARNATLDNRLGYIDRELHRLDERFEEYPPTWLTNQVNTNTVSIRELERWQNAVNNRSGQ